MEYVAEIFSASASIKNRDDLLEHHSAYQDEDENDYRRFAVDIDDGWSYVQEVAGNLQEDY